ncbi:PAS domain S-box protein [Chitinophaga sp. GCM10012297]|uniref:histidine kinase n=1 Tax=Chitinophaga chungangae TaxID=2821488 RepID=A0ABS3YAW7_9BACT|nr:PAS domain S-box protein [Chitinophaga chungangae]MBO9151818.1 PAS domain S-box protein [Chitinophaga chungangae]
MINLLSPARTVFIFLLFGVTWVLTTDSLLRWLSENTPSLLWKGNYTKGVLFVLISSGLLYLLLKKYKRSLLSSETAYIRIFRQSPQPMWVYDRETLRFVDVNDAALDLYGYSLEEFLKMTILQIRPPEEVSRLLESHKTVHPGFHDYGTWKHLKKNGALMYVDVNTFCTVYKGRDVEIVSVWDVTEKHEAYEALSRNEVLLNSMINSTGDLIWAVDEELRFTAFNKAYQDTILHFTGINISLGSKPILSDDEGELKRWEGYYRKSLGGEKQTIEEAREMANIGLSTAEITFNPIVNDDGKIVGVACFARDISERKNQELHLQRALERYNIVNLATHNVIWDWDLRTDNVLWNENMNTLFGHPAGSTEAGWWRQHVHPDDEEAAVKSLEETISRHGKKWAVEYRFRCADGEYRYVYDRGYVLYNQEGKPYRMIGAIEDIDDKKTYVEELKKVAHMGSHSLRRPVASMLGVVAALDKENLGHQDNLPLLAYIEKIAKEMDEIIHDVADKCNHIFKEVEQ